MNGNDYLSNGNGVTNKDTENGNTSSTASDSSKELASTGKIKNRYIISFEILFLKTY